MSPDTHPKHGVSFWEALKVGALLGFTDLVLLRFWILPHAGFPLSHVVPSGLVAVAAAAALALLALQFPALLHRERWMLPMGVVAPILHAALMALVATLGTTAPVGIQRAPEPLQSALLWLRPENLVLSVVCQFLLLALVMGVATSAAANPRAGR